MRKNILWTGGWDSTFRLLQLATLSNNDDVIQPIYVIGDNRRSESREILAMEELLNRIRKISNTQIDDVKIVNKNDIKEETEITEAFQRLKNVVPIGNQYEYLARLALQYPGIEIGIEKPNGEFSGCISAINKTGKLIKKGDSYYIDIANSSEDCCLVFGNFSFPIAFITETEMTEWVKEKNYTDIMKLIWFCHAPINGEACGFCRPCQQKMECGMEWLLPDSGKDRYRKHKKIVGIFGKGIGNIISRNILK